MFCFVHRYKLDTRLLIDNNEFLRIDYLIDKPVAIGNKSLSTYFILIDFK